MHWLSIKAAWKQGVDAAHAGEPLDGNPYPPNSPQFESWADGWRMDNVPTKHGKPQK
jgi:hypothetical protein